MVLGKLFISRGGGIATSPKKGTYQQFHACQKLWPKVPINYVEVEVPSKASSSAISMSFIYKQGSLYVILINLTMYVPNPPSPLI